MIINREELFKHYAGDEDILLDIIDVFIEQKDVEINKLKNAVKEKDAKLITLVSHTLKGIVGNFYAEDLKSKFFNIEQNGKKDNLDSMEKDLIEVEKIFPEFILEIESLKLDIQKRL